MSLYILTLNEAKRDLGLDDVQDDAALTLWMEGLQDRIDAFLNRKLLRTESVVELHDGRGPWIYLQRWPVESISSIHVDDDQEWDEASELDTTDYRAKLTRGKIGYGIRGTEDWPEGVQNIRVVYTGGYVAAGTDSEEDQYALPDAIRRGMLMQLGFEWRNRQHLGKAQVSGGNASVQFGAGVLLASKGITFLPEVDQTLAPYRRILV